MFSLHTATKLDAVADTAILDEDDDTMSQAITTLDSYRRPARFALSTKYMLNTHHGDPNAGGNHCSSS